MHGAHAIMPAGQCPHSLRYRKPHHAWRLTIDGIRLFTVRSLGAVAEHEQMDFFFNYASSYTYLTVMRIERAAARAGMNIQWRPFDVRAIYVEQNNLPFRDKPIKAQYMWRDIERRAARFAIEWRGVPPYPVDRHGLANRVGVIAADEGWVASYTRQAYRAWFLDHHDPGDPDVLCALLRTLDQDAVAVISRANTDAIRQRFAENTDAARRLGIFGSPTFAVGREIFWGDDRLEDALEWAVSAQTGAADEIQSAKGA
jgi:2-hydroxychromene-2-carboxylate isomerase